MPTLLRAAAAPRHTPAIEELYRRMLGAVDAHAQFLPRPSGRLVHVVRAGEGHPVVHLHATNTSSLSHLMLLKGLSGTGSYLVDRPGCGLSDPDPFRTGDLRGHAIGFVGDVLDSLGLDAVHLVGHRVAASGRSLVRPGPPGAGPWARHARIGAHPARWPVPLPLRMAATPGIGDLMVRAVKPGPRMLLKMMASVGEAETIVRHPDLLASLVAGARDPVAVHANLAELRALISPRGFRTSMRLTQEDLRRLTVPTLMMWGDRDPVVPLVHARAAAAEIPHARLETLPAGHVPQLGNPDRVAALLEDFVVAARPREHEQGGPGPGG